MKAPAAVLLLFTMSAPAAAQFSFTEGGVRRDSIATRFGIDLAVPEAPAFSLLQVSSGAILRPGTVREFAVQVSDFVDSKAGISVPKQFAFEFSPAMLLRGSRLTLSAYNSARPLYRLRLSAAVRRSANAIDQLAVGVRVALMDRADLRANPAYLADATAITTAINGLFADQNREHPPAPGQELTVDDLTAARRRKLAALAKQLKERVEERAWNADILDVAIGTLAASRDTTGEAVRLTQYAGWLTYRQGRGRVGSAPGGAARLCGPGQCIRQVQGTGIARGATLRRGQSIPGISGDRGQTQVE